MSGKQNKGIFRAILHDFHAYKMSISQGLHHAGNEDRESLNYREAWICADVRIDNAGIIRMPTLIYKHHDKRRTEMKDVAHEDTWTKQRAAVAVTLNTNLRVKSASARPTNLKRKTVNLDTVSHLKCNFNRFLKGVLYFFLSVRPFPFVFHTAYPLWVCDLCVTLFDYGT